MTNKTTGGHDAVDTGVIRAVLDTNVLVPYRLRVDLRQLAQDGAFIAVWSPWIIAELNRVLTWQWIEDSGNDTSPANRARCSRAANTMMEILLATPFELVNPLLPYPPTWPGLTDAWDHPIWAAAVSGHAHYVVSNNTRDYPPADAAGRHMYQGIEYVAGAVFIALLVGD